MTLLQGDSTQTTTIAAPKAATEHTEDGAQAPVLKTVRPAKPTHPYQVLRSLPADATPAQQDSAIQAAFKPEVINRSTRPDTLHLPGYGKGKSFLDVDIPTYYRESFFAKDSLFHPEISGGRMGVAGDPVPYTMRNDDVITSILLGCFILALVTFSQTRGFLVRQAKSFFYIPKSGPTTPTETTGEIRFQFFLVLQTCLLFSILCFFYTREYISETLILSSQYQLIGICFGVFVAYFVLKAILYSCLNWVFFDKKKNGQWSNAQLFIHSMEGVAIFPLVLLQVYFDLPMQSAITYALIIIILVKILSFYKCYVIFFRRMGVVLQIFLYFCALEIIPLLALGGILMMIGNYLKINY